MGAQQIMFQRRQWILKNFINTQVDCKLKSQVVLWPGERTQRKL